MDERKNMTNNALALYQNNDGFKELLVIANTFAQSGRFPDDKTAAQAIVKIMAGLELGLTPIFAMTNIILINGKVTLGASVVAALIKKSGKYDYEVLKHDDNECLLEFSVNGETVGQSHFTMEHAKAAGLTSKDVWKKFPRNMLFSRALTNGARWFAAEVFSGPIYTPEELQSGDAYDEKMVDITPKIIPEDDLANITYQDFCEKVRTEITHITDDEISSILRGEGKSWAIDSKREMYDYLKTLYV